MRRIIGLVLIVALTVLAPLAEQVRDQLWQSYEGYTSPYLAPLPRGATRMPMSPRVVVVLIRALRLAESQQMPTLNALRQRGSDITIEVPPPAFRLPSTFGILSGARPETYGVTTNGNLRQLPDNFVAALQTVTRTVALIGESNWGDWFEGNLRIDQPDEADAAARDGQAIDLALADMRDPVQPASFVLIELQLMETVATTDPSSYATAAAATDFRLKTLVDALDFNNSALVVLSDRGLTGVFHDGGDEAEVARVPMVMAGAGVAPGTQAIAPQSSVAPTIAALTGAPMPMQAQGGPIMAALSANSQLPLVSAQQMTTFYEQWSEVMDQPRFASELLRKHEAALTAGDTVDFLKWESELNAQVNNAVGARLASERTSRLPFVIGAGLMLILLAAVMLNSHPIQPLLGAIGYWLAFLALFLIGRGDRFSLSLFAAALPAPPLQELERNSGILMGAICIFVALATLRHEDAFDALTTVLCTLGMIALSNAAVVVWFYWQWGDAWTWTLPNSNALVFTMTSLTQIGAFLLPVTPDLPDIPIAVPVAIGAAIIFALVGTRRRRGGLDDV